VLDSQVSPPLEAPRGIYPARVDDKGRLKLPVPFQQYLSALPEKKLFATSLDRATARIYPIAVWRETENALRGARGEDASRARRVYFSAMELGADSELDGQGRVLLPPELRRTLGIENQGVHVLADRGRIDILSQAQFEERRRAAAGDPAADVEQLEMAGLV